MPDRKQTEVRESLQKDEEGSMDLQDDSLEFDIADVKVQFAGSDAFRVLEVAPALTYDLQQPTQLDGQAYIQLGLSPLDFIAWSRASKREVAASPGGATLAANLDAPDGRDGRDIDDGEDPMSDPAGKVVVELQIATPSPNEEKVGGKDGVTVDVAGTAVIKEGKGSIDHVEVEIGSGGFQKAESLGAGWSSWRASSLV